MVSALYAVLTSDSASDITLKHIVYDFEIANSLAADDE
jgi:hypothetical protein